VCGDFVKFDKLLIKQSLKKLLQTKILPVFYKLFSNVEVSNKRVIFADAHNTKLPYSMELLHEKFKSEGFEVIDIFCDYGHSGFGATVKSMLYFMKCYASAKYVIICDYFLPVSSAEKRKETFVVQLWHGCGAFKKFGYDAEDDISKNYKGSPSKNFDLVTVSSPMCENVYASAFKIPKDNVKALGICRTDCFFNEDYISQCKTDFYKEYPQAMGKKVVLWTPTFRGNAGSPKLVGKEYIEALGSKLGNEWFVIQKLHPHFKGKEYQTCNIPTERLLPVVDVLISDYSTVIFEYLLFDKPLVLFVPDFKEYYSKRGFYLDYYELPADIVEDGESLSEAVVSSFEHYDPLKVENFRKKYMSMCDGNATNRVYNAILKLT
jgi:CDP-ribitol ribitolphosphotransferase